MLQKANSDYDENRKEFLAFIGRTKGSIVALRNKTGVSVTSTKVKLRISQNHYQDLGKSSVDDVFGGKRVKTTLKNVVICHILVWMMF